MPGARKRQRLPEADDAGADNGDFLFCHLSWSSVAARDAFTAWIGAAFKPAVSAHDDHVRAGV